MCRAADLGLVRLGVEEASAGPRTRFQAAIDQLEGKLLAQAAFIVDDSVQDLSPGLEIAIGEGARQRRFHDYRYVAYRIGTARTCRR